MLSLCVKFVCVLSVLLRRRREEEKEEKPGIQNQKQEPHTKMWGISKPQWVANVLDAMQTCSIFSPGMSWCSICPKITLLKLPPITCSPENLEICN